MINKKAMQTPKDIREKAIEKLVSSLEALAWLYNCSKVQVDVSTFPSQFIENNNYWFVMKKRCYFFNKNYATGIVQMPAKAMQIIKESK